MGLTVNSLIDEGFGIFASITTVTPFTGTKTLGMSVQLIQQVYKG